MATQRSLKDFGISVGTMSKGKRNSITDVSGVRVGHTTIDNQRHKTGVTVVMPSPENPYLSKLTAAGYVLNGYGKTTGLIQIAELGTLETPIAITNTLNVGLVHNAIVGYIVDSCKKQGYDALSVNPIVCECNDGGLNDITQRIIGEEQVLSAIESASSDFMQGDTGAGKGTVCYGFKGGIGSASRIMMIDGKQYTLGVLVQSNYGNKSDLKIMNKPVQEENTSTANDDKGSIIMVLATDLPVDSRQLGRIIKRMSVGMARLGSYIGHGSGEVMIGFTSANPICCIENRSIIPQHILREDLLDMPFRAAGECCEEAILMSMLCADEVIGYKGNKIQSLADLLRTAHFQNA